jgi:hypothetical protein
VPGQQRILVVSTEAAPAELDRLRRDLGRRPAVLAAPTAEAKRVVSALRVDPEVEVLLAPVRFPDADRGQRLDTLVRRHALADRFRDVVVVTDQATSTLLLRVLAPDQLAEKGGVKRVGLPRAARQVSPRRIGVAGVVVGIVASAAEPLTPVVTLPAVAALLGLLLLLVPAVRHLGREVLLAAAIGFVVVVVMAAGSQRFPG